MSLMARVLQWAVCIIERFTISGASPYESALQTSSFPRMAQKKPYDF